MNCPACATVLQMMERQGVEIDYCPACRGVWLDRGELDKLVERAADAAPPAYRAAPEREGYRRADESRQWPAEDRYRERHYDDDDRERHYDGRYGKRRRKSFLSELFDFD